MESLGMFEQEFILSSIYNGIMAIDTRGTIIFFNKTAERIFKVPAHDALDRYILDVLPNTGEKLLECLKTGKPFYGEKLKGKEVILISNINPVVKNGNILGVVSVFQDISEIERILKELDLFKNMKNWLDTIIDSSYDGLAIIDHQGVVIRINKACERIYGVKAEEVIGKNAKELVSEGLYDRSITSEVFKRKASVTIIQKTKEGKRLLVTGNPIFTESGDIAFVVTNDRDITELDKLRNQLEQTQELAKRYISRIAEMEMKGVSLSNIIYRSQEMQRVIETALRIAEVDSIVLLLGESGVGKGMIAKLIHKRSQRSNGPFIHVDCAGIPDSLIESELFGYERGAFTGAKAEGKPGFLELANKGTLFLDEIAEIPINSQSKLLRFLEDREIVRVGGTEPRQFDVRVLAATNRNLEERISAKLFREDLYYRLNVIPLYIPALKERREDLLPLLLHYLEKFNSAYKKKKTFSPEALDILCKYNFPGNVRELANLAERVVVVTEKDRIEAKDLPTPISDYTAKTQSIPPMYEQLPLKDILEKCERLAIEKAIKQYGSQREAAKILKVDQATISRKAKKYMLCKGDAIVHNRML